MMTTMGDETGQQGKQAQEMSTMSLGLQYVFFNCFTLFTYLLLATNVDYYVNMRCRVTTMMGGQQGEQPKRRRGCLLGYSMFFFIVRFLVAYFFPATDSYYYANMSLRTHLTQRHHERRTMMMRWVDDGENGPGSVVDVSQAIVYFHSYFQLPTMTTCHPTSISLVSCIVNPAFIVDDTIKVIQVSNEINVKKHTLGQMTLVVIWPTSLSRNS